MGTSKGIRWPEDLAEEIEKARIRDGRSGFSDEVFYLVRLGLEEAEWQRQVIAQARAERRGEPAPRYEPEKDANFFKSPSAIKKEKKAARDSEIPDKASNGETLKKE